MDPMAGPGVESRQGLIESAEPQPRLRPDAGLAPNGEAYPAWQRISRENSCLAAEVLLQPYAFSRVRR
jgi:hypothetical protein